MESDDFLLYNNSEEEEEDDDVDEEEEDEDSGNVSSTGEDEDGLTLALLDNEPTSSSSVACPSERTESDEFPYVILTTEQIVQHMIDCIKEVNTIVQLPLTTTRILLNHFKWDKEKLYEMYYDGDREKLFSEAHIIDPSISKSIDTKSVSPSGLECCIICYRDLPAVVCLLFC